MNKRMVLCLLSLMTAVCFFPAAAAGVVNLDMSGTAGFVLEWKDWQDLPEGESGTTGDELLLENEVNLDLKLTSADQTSCFLSLLYQTGKAKIEIEEGYLEFNPRPNLMLRVGRQKVFWGTGFSWNPTNYLMPPKKTEEKGVDLFKLRLSGQNLRGSLLVKPGTDLEETEAAVRIGRMVHNKDFSISFYQGKDKDLGGKKSAVGFDFAVATGNYVFYGEVASKSGLPLFIPAILAPVPEGMEGPGVPEDPYFQGVAGFYRFLPGNRFLVVEYFHENQQDYISVVTSKTYRAGDFTVSSSILWNLKDQSYMLNPSFRYLLGANAYLELTAEMYKGKSGTVFGENPWQNHVVLELIWFFK
jgi:hypothetical protein